MPRRCRRIFLAGGDIEFQEVGHFRGGACGVTLKESDEEAELAAEIILDQRGIEVGAGGKLGEGYLDGVALDDQRRGCLQQFFTRACARTGGGGQRSVGARGLRGGGHA